MSSTHLRISAAALLLLSICISPVIAQDESNDEERKQFLAIEAQASKLIEANPRNANAYVKRAKARDELEKHTQAVTDITRAIEITPNQAEFQNLRGSMRFKTGDIAGSLADYDRAIQLNPKLNRQHWQRGIVCYYAGKYAAGAKQFAAYQTYDDNDVENVVWRFACMARDIGVEKARQEMLKVRHDRRIPMMKIYDLFRGKAKPDDVLKAAETEKTRAPELIYQRFYAHYYVGLYLECIGKPDLARPHLLAAAKFKNDHYMWHVARIHAEQLVKPSTTKP